MGKQMNLQKLVYDFRDAIETAIENGESGTFFRKFPTGQCGQTSDMLAQYLIDNGFESIVYVNGTYYGDEWNDRWSHTWLVVNDQIIDITGDQFKYHQEPLKNNVPVYIGLEKKFYDLFEIHQSGKHKHFGLDCRWSNYYELEQCYEIIKKYLNDI
ncbi:MAG: hypothetical protein IKV81_06680 [Clostridia bacterium]|nr:hypothetical protein [Clostridia bacterium]